MRYGSLFSGFGGLDMAVEDVFGAKAAWHSEIEPAACRVLEYRWPGVPLMGLPNGWVTDVGGTVNENLKMLGNGVVPQQAAAGIRLLLERVEGEWNSRSA